MAAVDVGDAAEHGGRAAWGVDRQILQRGQCIDVVLGCLQGNRIGDAVLLIQPVSGSNLAGAREVDHQAVGHIGGGDARILRARAVDVDIERRLQRGLLNARIRHAGDMAYLRQQFIRVGKIRTEVVAANL